MSLIGKTIKWRRNQLGFTQEKLAQGVCSVAQVSKLENDNASISDDQLTHICSKLEFDRETIVGEVDWQLKSQLEKWLDYLHEYDVPPSEDIFTEVKDLRPEQLHVDVYFLYLICLFGHYLVTDRMKEVEDFIDEVESKKVILKEFYPYSYHKFIGIYYRRKGMYSNAIEHLRIAEQELGDEIDPELYLVMATVYSRLNEILISNKYAQRAFKIFQEKLYYTRIIDCQIVLGNNYCLVGDFSSAEAYFNRVENLDAEHVFPNTRASIQHHIGYIHFQKYEYDQAEACFRKALELQVSPNDFLNAKYLLSFIYFRRDQMEAAKKEIQEGFDIARVYSNKRYNIKFNVLDLRLNKRKEDLVAYLSKTAIPFFEQNGEEAELKHYYYLIGQVLFELNRYKKSAEYLMKATEDFMV
ncbi:hypothetical protein CEY16_10625 [Halalkalibacillus sediminis]|uniref:HTH cro/C1-type domain-containing protein n=1 Tax=Halalkalibacillus sediminis TaxID=2018042 RepID=A0A2I0QS71_9BACI|nr:helix-turn-helix transcriptional regulator [Halalkalibacillus sediminis]PKR77187.1 hypothetical protein CEY16_10625 [Halalkalibacillus sediminis]